MARNDRWGIFVLGFAHDILFVIMGNIPFFVIASPYVIPVKTSEAFLRKQNVSLKTGIHTLRHCEER
jgi:hypothetical protein